MTIEQDESLEPARHDARVAPEIPKMNNSTFDEMARWRSPRMLEFETRSYDFLLLTNASKQCVSCTFDLFQCTSNNVFNENIHPVMNHRVQLRVPFDFPFS